MIAKNFIHGEGVIPHTDPAQQPEKRLGQVGLVGIALPGQGDNFLEQLPVEISPPQQGAQPVLRPGKGILVQVQKFPFSRRVGGVHSLQGFGGPQDTVAVHEHRQKIGDQVVRKINLRQEGMYGPYQFLQTEELFGIIRPGKEKFGPQGFHYLTIPAEHFLDCLWRGVGHNAHEKQAGGQTAPALAKPFGQAVVRVVEGVDKADVVELSGSPAGILRQGILRPGGTGIGLENLLVEHAPDLPFLDEILAFLRLEQGALKRLHRDFHRGSAVENPRRTGKRLLLDILRQFPERSGGKGFAGQKTGKIPGLEQPVQL